MCRGEFKYCQEAVDNMESVTSCPTSKKEWESAANRKHCQLTAAQQKCSEPETFVYHCVINGYGNETLEVCAPRRLMIGNVFNLKTKHAWFYFFRWTFLQSFFINQFCSSSAF